MDANQKVERLFKRAKPPVSGSTTWYDACDLLGVAVKQRLRKRFKRGFQVEAYGDVVGVILRVRGDGYGVAPWSVDRPIDYRLPLTPQIDEIMTAIEAQVAETYIPE